MMIRCLQCEETCSESELSTREEFEGNFEAWGARMPCFSRSQCCPTCGSLDLEDVYMCETCGERESAEGSDNCDECDEIVAPIARVVDDLAQPRVMREIDFRNAECRGKWASRYHSLSARDGYADLRGEIEAPVIDQEYEQKRRVARAILSDIEYARAIRKVPALPSLLMRQAS